MARNKWLVVSQLGEIRRGDYRIKLLTVSFFSLTRPWHDVSKGSINAISPQGSPCFIHAWTLMPELYCQQDGRSWAVEWASEPAVLTLLHLLGHSWHSKLRTSQARPQNLKGNAKISTFKGCPFIFVHHFVCIWHLQGISFPGLSLTCYILCMKENGY